MFKRYKPPYDESNTSVTEKDNAPKVATRRPSPYAEEMNRQPYGGSPAKEAPPRIFDARNSTPQPQITTPAALPANHELENEWLEQPPVTPAASLELDGEQAETTLGAGVVFKGELSFERLLRIDGKFEGELNSKGKMILGPQGYIKSNSISLHEAVIEGVVEGNITVAERIELRGDAKVRGNITAQSISVDEGVSIIGHVDVSPAGDVVEPIDGVTTD